MSTVSVILPTYNRAESIVRAIKSVLNQTYSDYELIVVDDGSADDTEKIISSIHNKKIKYIQNKENKGAGAARNIGIQKAKGKFIAFQDSDDEWHLDKLKKQVDIFTASGPELGVVYSDMERILINGKKRYSKSPTIDSSKLIDSTTQFYTVFNIGIQTAMIKKECLKRVGLFREELPRYEDLELFIRLSRCYKFHHIKDALVDYHETKGLSSNDEADTRARKMLLSLYSKELVNEKKFILKEMAYIGRSNFFEDSKETRL